MKNLFVVFVLAITAAGCAGTCSQAAHKDDKICIAEREFTTCGPKAVGIIDMILPQLIAQDWTGALDIVAAQAPDEYECIADVLDDKISKGTYGPAHQSVQQFRSARRLRAIDSHGHFKIIPTDAQPKSSMLEMIDRAFEELAQIEAKIQRVDAQVEQMRPITQPYENSIILDGGTTTLSIWNGQLYEPSK